MNSPLHYIKVYPLPSVLSLDDKSEFLKLFGAVDVRHASLRGKKQVAIAGFKTHNDCRHAISRLHQLEFLGKRLQAYFHDGVIKNNSNESNESLQNLKKLKEFEARLTPVSSELSLSSKIPTPLRYKYPEITSSILANIANAISAVPELYTQVLHLMNKMNLPPPFGEPFQYTKITEKAMEISEGAGNIKDVNVEYEKPNDVKSDGTCWKCKRNDVANLPDDLNSSESELESENEESGVVERISVEELKARKRKTQHSDMATGIKRAKLQLQQNKKLPTSNESISKQHGKQDAFTLTDVIPTNKVKLSLPSTLPLASESNTESRIVNLEENQNPDSLDKNLTSVTEKNVDGFGKLAAKSITDSCNSLPVSKYITTEELENNKVKESEYAVVPVLSNYSPGSPSSRLYIKNLAKNTTSENLKYIYERFVHVHYMNHDPINCDERVAEIFSDDEKFKIKLMQEGRMKGQAFVTLPSVAIAEEARKNTNGYILNDKPMVVAFAKVKK